MSKPYYQDESCTIYHGDCLEVLPTIGPADLCLTDPPYNVGLAYSDGDDRTDYAEWTRSWFDAAPRPLVLTPGVVNLSMWLAMAKPRWTCVWVKPNQSSASALNGFNVWEPVLVYGKHVKPVGHDAWVVSINSDQEEARGHPCPKFLPFWERLVSAFSNEGALIVDPFLGSGTTAVACKLLRRRCVGIEQEERYCEMAALRLSQGVMDFGEAIA